MQPRISFLNPLCFKPNSYGEMARFIVRHRLKNRGGPFMLQLYVGTESSCALTDKRTEGQQISVSSLKQSR
jgi:hypothetical protein